MGRHWSKREERLALAASAVMALSLSYHAVGAPCWTSWRALEAQIAGEEAHLHRAAATVDRREAVEAAGAPYRTVLISSASTEETMSALLDAVHVSATMAPLLVTQLQPRPAQREPGWIRQAVELQAAASLEQLIGFLAALRRQAPAAKVTWMQIAAARAAPLHLHLVIETLQFDE